MLLETNPPDYELDFMDPHLPNPEAAFVKVNHVDNLFLCNQDLASNLKGVFLQESNFKSKKCSFEEKLDEVKRDAFALFEDPEDTESLYDGSFEMDMYGWSFLFRIRYFSRL